MKIKIVLLSLLVIILNCNAVFPAAVPDDDSAVFLPVPEKKNETPIKKSVKKATVKKPVKKSKPKKTVKKTPPKPQAPKVTSLQRGIELMKQERYEAAKPWLIKAIQEEKNNPNAWYWYGVYHEKTGGFYQAQYFYSKAVKIDPTFDPLSRVVVYPEDPNGKNPLWDPKRPARVYPIETVNKNVVTIPPDSPQARKLPSRASKPENNTEIPKVPVYTPPEPGAYPLDGDDWRTGIYVPPTASQARENQSPVYVPPSVNQNVNTKVNHTVLELQADDFIIKPENQNDEIISDPDLIIRADKPLYQPPKPGEKIQTPKISQPKHVETPKVQPSVPRRIVRKNTSAAQQPRQTRTTQTQTQTQLQTSNRNLNRSSTRQQQISRQNQQISNDVTTTQNTTQTQRNSTPRATPQTRPETPTRQTRPTNINPPRTAQEVPEVTARPQNNNTENQRSRENNNENNREGNRESNLPPVGQFSPDPGTISDRPLPPIGQGSSNQN